MDRQLRDLLDAAAGEPPRQVSVEAVRRRVTRRRAKQYLAGAAAVAVIAVIAVIIPAGIGALGHPAGPSAGGQRPAAVPTIYISYEGGYVYPIPIATGTAGKPIKVGSGPGQIAITPDGKTAYVSCAGSGTVTPINTATNTAGKPIRVGRAMPGIGGGRVTIAITPDGKTAYVTNVGIGHGHPDQHGHQHRRASRSDRRPCRGPGACRSRSPRTGRPPTSPTMDPGTVTPIDTATNTPGKPINIGSSPRSGSAVIAITPDGKTVYVESDDRARSPRSTPPPTRPASRSRSAATPALSRSPRTGRPPTSQCQAEDRARSPRSARPPTRPGKPIKVGRFPAYIAITPDGKTVYVDKRRIGHGDPDRHRHQHGRQADQRRPQPRSRSRSPRTGRPPTS